MATNSRTASICSRVTSNCSITSSMLRSSRFWMTVATGRRVPLNTHAPFTFPGMLSTAWHCGRRPAPTNQPCGSNSRECARTSRSSALSAAPISVQRDRVAIRSRRRRAMRAVAPRHQAGARPIGKLACSGGPERPISASRRTRPSSSLRRLKRHELARQAARLAGAVAFGCMSGPTAPSSASAACTPHPASANAVLPVFGRPFDGAFPIGNFFDHDKRSKATPTGTSSHCAARATQPGGWPPGL